MLAVKIFIRNFVPKTTEEIIMGRFINPFTDLGFKRIFGQEFSKPVLIGFLNALLTDERSIKDVQFVDKEQIGIDDDDRSLVYDILCETDGGEKIIVEMQNRYQPFFKERTIYYAARAIIEQGMRGREWQYNLKAVYVVSFMDFSLSDVDDNFRIDVALMDMTQHTVFSDKVRLIYLQLPYFKKTEEECTTTFDRLIYVLKNMDVFDRMPWAAKDAVFHRMAEIAEFAKLDHTERLRYETEVKHYRDTIAVMHGQYLQGEEKGRAEGRAEGEAKGRAEEKLENARSLKANGVAEEIIAKSLGLTADEIRKL